MCGFGKENKQILEKRMYRQVVELLLVSCAALKKDMLLAGDKLQNDEGAITYRLIEHYLNNDEFRRKNNLHYLLMRFQPEHPIHFNSNKCSYIGRVDIQVIGIDHFHDVGRYGVIECKRLDESSKLKREYVNEGIERFVGGMTGEIKYRRHKGFDLMLGYLVAVIMVNDMIEKINKYIGKRMSEKVVRNLSVQKKEEDKWYFCDSSFLCADNEERNIGHLFYNFGGIIE